ncbi:hypothetical protein D3C78_1771370 [compost metagenome]
MAARGQHADHDLRALHRGFGAGRNGQARGRELVACLLGKVEGRDDVAGLLQIDGHGAAHVAESDECDLHACLLVWLLEIQSSLSMRTARGLRLGLARAWGL